MNVIESRVVNDEIFSVIIFFLLLLNTKFGNYLKTIESRHKTSWKSVRCEISVSGFFISLKLELELFLVAGFSQQTNYKSFNSRESSVNMEASNGESPGSSFNLIATSPTVHSHSSPENSPRNDTNPMDTSVELNGLKSENRSSQQFCLRWNNHQVRIWESRKNKRRNHKSPNKSIESTSAFFNSTDTAQLFAFENAFRPRFSAKNFSTLAVTECSCCSKKKQKKNSEKKSETDFPLKKETRWTWTRTRRGKRKESRKPIAARTTWLFSKNKRNKKKTIIKLVFSNVPLFCYLSSDLLMPTDRVDSDRFKRESSSCVHSLLKTIFSIFSLRLTRLHLLKACVLFSDAFCLLFHWRFMLFGVCLSINLTC